MNYTTTLLRLTKALFLVATLIGYSASLPIASRPPKPSSSSAINNMDSAMETSKAPKLKQLQEASHAATGTRTHEFPANSIDSLERDMREAETTTTAEVMAETTPSGVEEAVASGDATSDGVESTTAPTQPDSSESPEMDGTSTQTARTERSPSPRDHFKQLMRTYYTNPTGGLQELSTFFSLSEMYRLGPLATDSRVDNPPSHDYVVNSRKLCQRMVDRLNTRQSSTDICHWTYSCNYNANRFPSMIVNATQCTPAQGARCVQRVAEMQTFTRTFNGIEPTWTRDDELASVVYAYTCRRLH